jgi:hypothetical protein
VTPAEHRARAVVLGPGAAPLAVGLALVPLLGQGSASPAVVWLGGLGLVLYAVALAAPWPRALPWALGALAVEYLVALVLRGASLDAAAPAYAAAWFLCAELGWLGLEARAGGGLWPGRALGVGLLALGGAALGTGLLLAAALPLPGGPALTAGGVAAAIGVAGCLAWLARR